MPRFSEFTLKNHDYGKHIIQKSVRLVIGTTGNSCLKK